MAARDLKLTAVLVDKVSSGLAKAGQDWKKAIEEPAKAAIASGDATAKALQAQRSREAKEYEKFWANSLKQQEAFEKQKISMQRSSIALQEKQNQKSFGDDERLIRQKIALQRSSIALEEKMIREREIEANRSQNKLLAESKNAAETELRIKRQAAIAESALVLDKFDRMIAKEKQIHAFRLADLKGNDAAMEAEIRRHNAVVGRMSMDKANFPNTPFQSLLSSLTNVTSQMGLQVPQAINLMQSNMAGAARGAAGLAVGLAAAGAGAIALGAGLKIAYGEARESIDADKKLDLVLRSTGKGADFTTAELSKLANQYQETTDFTDEAVKSAQTILLRYDAIGKDVFPKALKASADLGAETGDLAGAAFNLGSALQMPEEAGKKLTAMGIRLTDTEKEMLQQFADTGETIKAQEFILDKVAKAYGGNAETMSHDTVKLGHAVGELAETLGGPLVKAADAAAAALLGLFKSQDKEKVDEYYQSIYAGTIALNGQTVKVNQALIDQKKLIAEAQKQEQQKTAGPNADQSAALARMIAEETKAKEEAKKAEKAASEISRAEKEDDAKSAAQFQVDQFKAARAKEYEEAKATRAAIAFNNAAADAEDERVYRESLERKKVAKAASLQTEQTSAAGNPLALLAIQQREELIAVEGNETAITEIKRRHEMERRTLTLMTSQATAAGVASNLAKVASQYKSFSGVAKKAAQVQNAMDTYAGATAAYKSAAGIPLVGWLIAPIAAAAAVAGGLDNASKINSVGFEQGGWTGNGGRTDVAGVVHGGEMVWSQADVRRAGGRQAAENIRQGNSTTSVSAPINIVINGNADDRTVRAMGKTIEQTLKDHAWRTEQVKYRGITA